MPVSLEPRNQRHRLSAVGGFRLFLVLVSLGLHASLPGWAISWDIRPVLSGGNVVQKYSGGCPRVPLRPALIAEAIVESVTADQDGAPQHRNHAIHAGGEPAGGASEQSSQAGLAGNLDGQGAAQGAGEAGFVINGCGPEIRVLNGW